MRTQTVRERKVLVIAYGFPPIAHVGVYRTIRFCRYLPDNGWKPTVITIHESGDIHSDPALLDRVPPEVRIHRTYIPDPWRAIRRYQARRAERDAAAGGGAGGLAARVLSRPWSLIQSILLRLFSIPDHMLFWVPFAVARGIRLMREQDFDVIYTSSPPHSQQLIGLILARLFHKPWVADLRDPIVGNFNSEGLFGFELKVHSLLEKIIVKNADMVIAVTKHHQQALSERHPDQASRFAVIMNGFDPALFENIEPERYDRFTIIFAGTLYGAIRPDFFVKAFSQWLETRDPSTRERIQVLFYGIGSDRAEILGRELGLEGVVSGRGLVPQKEIYGKLKGADLLLLIIGDNNESRGVVSAKVFEYMALERPILAIVPEGEALEVLREHGNAYYVPHDDYDAFAQAMDNAFDAWLDPGRVQGDRQAVRDLVGSAFDARHQAKDLIRVFNQALLHAPGAPGGLGRNQATGEAG